MKPRYFTLEEANRTVDEIRPLMADILERRARIVTNQKPLLPILEDLFSNVGSALGTEIAHEFLLIEEKIKQIRSYGCYIKDLNVGLLDFLSEKDGFDIYLCWRYDEPKITHYHHLHEGFMNRQSL